mgnify:CR=1 FL=1
MTNRLTEKEMLQAIAGGSESAFVRFFDEYSPRIYHTALKFLQSRELAEEIVQDVFMDIWLGKEKMQDVINLNACVYGMVRKKVFDAYRQRSSFETYIQELKFSSPTDNTLENSIQEREYEQLLQNALSQLPVHQREIFRLAREEGLSHEEIARKLNLSRLSVKAHMKRALAFLRRKLGPIITTVVSFLFPLFGLT